MPYFRSKDSGFRWSKGTRARFFHSPFLDGIDAPLIYTNTFTVKQILN